MSTIKSIASGLTMAAVFFVGAGCGEKSSPSPKADGKAAKPKEEQHSHGAGPHGGALADWGGGKFHVEFTVDHDKQEATVYILATDEKSASPIKAKEGQITAKIKGVKNKDNFELVLKAAPQPDDPEGKSSRFVGKHEKIGVVQEFAGTIIGEVDGTPYTGDFEERP